MGSAATVESVVQRLERLQLDVVGLPVDDFARRQVAFSILNARHMLESELLAAVVPMPEASEGDGVFWKDARLVGYPTEPADVVGASAEEQQAAAGPGVAVAEGGWHETDSPLTLVGGGAVRAEDLDPGEPVVGDGPVAA